VIIASSNHEGPPCVDEFEGLTVYRFPSRLLFGGRLPLLVPGRKTARMTALLAREKIDFVIVQTHLYPLSLHGARFARKRALPLIVIEHGSGYVYLGNRLIDTIGHCWEHVSVALLKRSRPAFYAVSQRASQWLERYGIRSKGELYNAIEPDEAQRAQAHPVRDFRTEYQIAPECLVVSFVSRLVPGKGVQKTIDAVRAACEQGVSLVLFVAGDGALLEDISRQEGDGVVVLGKLSHQEVLALLGQSDLFCLPTEHPEGFPTVLLEAAASGCFCISADEGGAGELIQDGQSGILLREPSVEELKRALMRAVEDESFRLQGAERVRDCVLALFTWEVTAQKTQETFRRLSGNLSGNAASGCESAPTNRNKASR
jgi:glycosyltransferase involved in cell wall biosynthesis